jgi:hypothetical protein
LILLPKMTTAGQAGYENGAVVDGAADEINAPFVPHVPARTLTRSTVAGGFQVFEPVHPTIKVGGAEPVPAALVFKDGTAYKGYSFGAEKGSVAGECVFQTGKSLGPRRKGSPVRISRLEPSTTPRYGRIP